MKCPKCGSGLPEQVGPGRPRKYCGPVCLKLATMEIRRLDGHIGTFEARESQLRLGGYRTAALQVRAEIDRLEARLAELVGGDNDSGGGNT